MSLKAKMLALCVSLCVLSAGIGLTAYWGVQTVIGEYSKLVVYSLPNVQTADEMFLAFRRIRIQLRTLGLTGLPQEAANAAVSEVKNAIDTYEKANQKYAEIPFMDGEQALYDDVNSTWLSFKKLGEEVLRLHATGLPADKEKMLSIFLKDCPDHAKAYTEKINTLLAYHRKNARQWSDDATLKGRNVSQQIALLVIAGSLLDIGVGIFFASSLSKSIRVIATELASGAEQVAQASTQISTSASSLSQATSEQASSLEETVATMEEMTSAVQMNSKNAQQASTQASETEKVATKGADEINLLVGSIEDISADSQKIEEIISVIDDIAFQTNLLALNAAVEAARAGEQGKGFAVVAEAVRSLAQRSAVAAKDISALIQGSVAKIEKGTQQAKQSGQVLEEIVKAVKQVSSLNTEIAAASQEQSQGIEQIGRAMNQMDQVTQQNAAGAEEAAAASEELSAQSLSLNKCVSNLISIIEGARSERGRTASDPAPQKAHAVRSRAA